MTDDFRTRIYERYFTTTYGEASPATEAAFRLAEPALRELLLPYLPADRGARIADVACGIGYALEMLRNAGYANAVGIDLSAEQVEVARRRQLPVERAEALAFLREREGHWDALLALDFLEHLRRDELFEFLDAARFALKPGGRLVIKTPNALSPLASRFRWRDLTHELVYSEHSLRQAFVTCGLRTVTIVGERFRPLTAKAWARSWVAGALRARWRLDLVAELGSEDLRTPLEFNLIAVAERP
jgi:2-polyprenyl-3-methyl-5-hydroxy-6-metoxy-1,4-benzoquinol methylase